MVFGKNNNNKFGGRNRLSKSDKINRLIKEVENKVRKRKEKKTYLIQADMSDLTYKTLKTKNGKTYKGERVISWQNDVNRYIKLGVTTNVFKTYFTVMKTNSKGETKELWSQILQNVLKFDDRNVVIVDSSVKFSDTFVTIKEHKKSTKEPHIVFAENRIGLLKRTFIYPNLKIIRKSSYNEAYQIVSHLAKICEQYLNAENEIEEFRSDLKYPKYVLDYVKYLEIKKGKIAIPIRN